MGMNAGRGGGDTMLAEINVTPLVDVMLVLLIIFIFGSEVIQGFVFALIVGVVVGTYSSLFIASPIAFNFVEKRAQIKAKARAAATKKGKK